MAKRKKDKSTNPYKDRATQTTYKNVLSLFQNKVTTENNHRWCITD